MIQVVSPNLNAVGRITYCLEYASRLVFQNPAAGTTAWNAWLVCDQQENQNFPTGVAFPVWFSGAGGAGHVAVFTPQGIYSSPYNQLIGHAVLPSISEVERIYSVKYVGWSPDILGLTVIKQGGIMPTDAQIDNFISYTHYLNFGTPADPATFDDWRKILKNNYVEGTISIQQGSDANPGALKNKPNTVPGATQLTKGNYFVQ